MELIFDIRYALNELFDGSTEMLVALYPYFCEAAEQLKLMDEGDEKEYAEDILIESLNIYSILLTSTKEGHNAYRTQTQRACA